jgi:glutathione peroxidase-family protein
MAELQLEQEARASSINSFFDLEAEDIDGNLIPFEKFRGHVTVITNVASYCGFTESHYKSLVELWSQVRHEPVNILAFPCNQFGNQEPGTAEEIKAFAKSKGVEFTMMNKIDVNGANTSLIYLFLKNRAGPRDIAWNFGTYFVVSGDGDVTSHSGVDPMDLMGTIANMLGKEEL